MPKANNSATRVLLFNMVTEDPQHRIRALSPLPYEPDGNDKTCLNEGSLRLGD